jgi:hypothetical protein
MKTTDSLAIQDIKTALAMFDRLSKEEYGEGLEETLLRNDGALRMQRLTGIVLKRPFATPGKPPAYSQTGARRAWNWNSNSPEDVAAAAPREFKILAELRMPGPWNERKPLEGTAEDEVPITWEELKDDAEHERGLFKILALYVDDKLNGRRSRTLREYVEADESRKFEAGLDLATLLFDAGVTGPVAALLGIPSLAVGISLVGIQYGYRKLTDTTQERIGDQSS